MSEQTSLHPWRRWLIDRWRDEAGLIAGLFAAGSLLLGFALLAEEVIEGDTQRIDDAILALFRGQGGRSVLPGSWRWSAT